MMVTTAVRTTVTLPSNLLDELDRAVKEGRSRSRNELIANAIRRELAAQKRSAIDAEFAKMADDEEYRTEAETITAEFATADWEASRQSEAGE
ncbi:MAG: CopG family ribbon-helix-helix protein [Chloroflexota bacterium]